MAAPKKYNATAKGLMMWTSHELEHVGRIAAVEDPDLRYSYAISTLNGMAHLKDALFEYIIDNPKSNWVHDLQITHDNVVRVMKHLIKDYNLQIAEIEVFNTHKVLSSLNYLRNIPDETIPPIQDETIPPIQRTSMNQMVPIQRTSMNQMVPTQPNKNSNNEPVNVKTGGRRKGRHTTRRRHFSRRR